MATFSSYSMVSALVAIALVSNLWPFKVTFAAGSLYQDVDIPWGDGRGKTPNNGRLLTLSLDRASNSGFQSKNQFFYGKIDLQIKLVSGSSAGIVTA